jgi:hypothetical protein
MSSITEASTTPTVGGAEQTPKLSELCGDAANHVAQARIALFSEEVDADGALAHLDQAIFLLQRLSAHGRAMGLIGSRSFVPPRIWPARSRRRRRPHPEFRLGLRQPAAEPDGPDRDGEAGGVVGLDADA